MKLADDYAKACFDQALHLRITDDKPETARKKLEKELHRLHAHVQELEAQLEAVGAGGVQPLSCKGCCKRGDIVQIAEPEKVDELNCVCGATWVRHSNGVYGMTYLPRPAPKGHSITDALEALQEAEAALEVACARLEKQRADYPVGATSEGKALMLVRKVLAAQAKQGGA